MSFINAIFLLALPIIAVPIVLHLFRRKQKEVISWGAMEFLTDAVTRGRRWERLEEILLMLLRVAALAVLVFALAQPSIRGYWLGVAPAREVVLVLDNSLSMAREAGGASAFDGLRDRARQIIDDLSDQDLVQVVLVAGRPQWMTPEALRPTGAVKGDLKRQIAKLQPTRAGADLFGCVQIVASADTAEEALARRIIVLTDRQANGWQADAEPAWKRFQQFCENSTAPITIEVLDCGNDSDDLENLVVTNLEASHTLVAEGEAATLRAEVKNVGAAATGATSLDWWMGADSIGSDDVPKLQPGETKSFEISRRLSEKGVVAFRAELKAEDDLNLDNDASVVVEAVDELPILVVRGSGSPGLSERLSDLTFFTHALGYQGDQPVGKWHSLFKPKIIAAEELEEVPLSDYRAIAILSLSPLPESTLERLTEFVHNGGGLWVALAGGIDRDDFNAAWFDDGAGLSPLPLAELEDRTGQRDGQVSVHPPEGNHPALTHLADTERLDIDTVEISRYFRFDRDRADASVLLETGTGEPLAIENYVGRGRVIVQAFPLGYGWSNLPRTKAFVVLVHDWLSYLSQPAAARFNVPAGGVLEWRPPADLAGAEAELTTPDGEEIELTALEDEGSQLYRYRQTDVPGAYDLKLTEGRRTVRTVPFRVPRDAAESELTPLSEDEVAMLADAGGVQFVDEIKTAAADLPNVPNEKPMWWPLLWTLLVLLVVELLFSTRSARQRYAAGPAMPSTTTRAAA